MFLKPEIPLQVHDGNYCQAMNFAKKAPQILKIKISVGLSVLGIFCPLL